MSVPAAVGSRRTNLRPVLGVTSLVLGLLTLGCAVAGRHLASEVDSDAVVVLLFCLQVASALWSVTTFVPFVHGVVVRRGSTSLVDGVSAALTPAVWGLAWMAAPLVSTAS